MLPPQRLESESVEEVVSEAEADAVGTSKSPSVDTPKAAAMETSQVSSTSSNGKFFDEESLFTLKIADPVLKVRLVDGTATSETSDEFVNDVPLLQDVARRYPDGRRDVGSDGVFEMGVTLDEADGLGQVVVVEVVGAPLHEDSRDGIRLERRGVGPLDVVDYEAVVIGDAAGDPVERRRHRLLDDVDAAGHSFERRWSKGVVDVSCDPGVRRRRLRDGVDVPDYSQHLGLLLQDVGASDDPGERFRRLNDGIDAPVDSRWPSQVDDVNVARDSVERRQRPSRVVDVSDDPG